MRTKIITAYTELKSLSVEYVHSIAQINWWLLKYGDLYKEVLAINSKLCKRCIQLESKNLPYDCLDKPPYCNKISEYSTFINFYDIIDELTEFHKLEHTCLLANDVYLFLDFHQIDLKEWKEENSYLFEQLCMFFYEHLDLNNPERINYYSIPNNSVDIIIEKSNFKECISFCNYYEEYLRHST